ncbi:Scr1 family TA system antitoxin-like transcriptional regulator [Streptomyces sp. P5-A9]
MQVLPMACEDHSALEGPFILLTPGGGQQLAYLEVRSTNRLVTDAEEVRIPAARYGSIRGQALSPHEPLALIEELLGER